VSWVKRITGLAGFDIFIQAAVTIAVMVFFGIEGDEEIIPWIVASSFAILGVRRHFALKNAAHEPEGLTTGQMAAYRFEELEQRLAELESVNGRMVELEERLDFAERLLAQSSAERARIGEGSRSDG
jgi:hypothetical protein